MTHKYNVYLDDKEVEFIKEHFETEEIESCVNAIVTSFIVSRECTDKVLHNYVTHEELENFEPIGKSFIDSGV